MPRQTDTEIPNVCKWTDLISRIVERPKGVFDRRFYHNKPELVKAGKQLQYLASLPRLLVYPFSADYSYTVQPLTVVSDYLSSEWDRTAGLKWAQKRSYNKQLFPVRFPLDRQFDRYGVRTHDEWELIRQKDVPVTRPRNSTTEQRRVWRRTRNHKWIRQFWNTRIADMRPAAKKDIKTGTPEWKMLWREMSAAADTAERGCRSERSMALQEWRESLWKV